MDMGRFLIETHLRTGTPIKELAAAHEVSASWLFKLLRRYRLEGAAGLEPRSRRPNRSPTRIADLYEDEIVALHKELADDRPRRRGGDHPLPPGAHVTAAPPRSPPSGGCSKPGASSPPSPRSGRRARYIRFAADLPNECWQADMTHVALERARSSRSST